MNIIWKNIIFMSYLHKFGSKALERGPERGKLVKNYLAKKDSFWWEIKKVRPLLKYNYLPNILIKFFIFFHLSPPSCFFGVTHFLSLLCIIGEINQSKKAWRSASFFGQLNLSPIPPFLGPFLKHWGQNYVGRTWK